MHLPLGAHGVITEEPALALPGQRSLAVWSGKVGEIRVKQSLALNYSRKISLQSLLAPLLGWQLEE